MAFIVSIRFTRTLRGPVGFLDIGAWHIIFLGSVRLASEIISRTVAFCRRDAASSLAHFPRARARPNRFVIRYRCYLSACMERKHYLWHHARGIFCRIVIRCSRAGRRSYLNGNLYSFSSCLRKVRAHRSFVPFAFVLRFVFIFRWLKSNEMHR